MAYDRDLADRVRAVLVDESPAEPLSEKAMFGGLAFFADGAMAVCVSHEGGLLLRVDPDERERLLVEPGVDPFVMRGRQMAGWLRVDAAAVAADDDLDRWVARGLAAARVAGPSTRR